MKNIRRSILLSLGLILTACLVLGAAGARHPEKKCYDSAGDEIPCPNSNYSETQFAARATARHSGPTAQPGSGSSLQTLPTLTQTASPTPSPTATLTNTAPPPTEDLMPTLSQGQQAAPPVAPAAQQPTSQPSLVTLLVLLGVVGLAGVLVVLVLVLLFRWLSGRRNAPPGPSS